MIISRRLKALTLFIMLALPFFCCNAQGPCIVVKAEFTNADAPESLKQLTVNKLVERVKKQTRKKAEIILENGNIVAKLPCPAGGEPSRYFGSERFAIYETYSAAEIESTVNKIAAFSNKRGVNFDELITGTAGGATIGYCPVARMEFFEALINSPECKKLLPDDLVLAFGLPENKGEFVAVYAVKIAKDKASSFTIDMMEETGIVRSFDRAHYDVTLEFKKEYKAAWETFTQKNTGNCIAIMLGDKVLTCPMLAGPISNAKASISARMDKEEAQAMAERINMSLPLEILITEVKTL